MLISDLNYLNEVSSESTDLSGGFNLGNDYSNIYFNEYFKIRKNVYSNVVVKGFLATSESDAKAVGYGAIAQTFTNTYTQPGLAIANGVSISASN